MVKYFFRKSNFYKVQLLMAIALFSWSAVLAQDSGEMTFKANCMACHTVGSGRLVGPDLKGVTSKYEEDWLVNFIKSSQSMVAEGDERAVKIFNEFMIPMPDQPLNDDQIVQVLGYIKEQSTPEEPEVASEKREASDGENQELAKTEKSFNAKDYGFINTVIFGVMGVETVTIFVLISLLIALIRLVKDIK